MNLIGTVAEESSALVTVEFEDLATGLAATPKTATFTLMKTDGTKIVDNRAATISGTEAQCLLSGADLVYSDDGIRIIVVEATYDSTLGNNIPAKAVERFKIQDILSIT